MKTAMLFFILILSSFAGARGLDKDFVYVPEEFIFRADGPGIYTAETARADLGLTTQSGAFFGSLQLVGKNRIRLNLSGQYFEIPALIQWSSGRILGLFVPMSAFNSTNTPLKRRGAFECVATDPEHLQCTQTLYLKSGIPAL